MLPRVLVVDDDLDLLDMLHMTLSEQGFEVFTAYDANSALEACILHAPGVVLLDIGLPYHDGFAIMREWRSLGLDVPVILHTAYNTLDVREKASTSGAHDLVFKPSPPSVLATKLQFALAASTQTPA